MAPSKKRPTQSAHATLDALHNQDGVVPNKALTPSPKSRKRQGLVQSHTVLVARLPVRRWVCDGCGTVGYNWAEMRRHVDRTGHMKYTGDYTSEELTHG